MALEFFLLTAASYLFLQTICVALYLKHRFSAFQVFLKGLQSKSILLLILLLCPYLSEISLDLLICFDKSPSGLRQWMGLCLHSSHKLKYPMSTNQQPCHGLDLKWFMEQDIQEYHIVYKSEPKLFLQSWNPLILYNHLKLLTNFMALNL